MRKIKTIKKNYEFKNVLTRGKFYIGKQISIYVLKNNKKTNVIGIISKAGRYGGTYAHKDIAFEFGMWISPKFKLLLIKEFERLKSEEQKQIGWNAKRELSKINYRIHTDAIKQNLVPTELTKEQINYIYSEEMRYLS